MTITRQIGNNVAVALDDSEREVVVFGKGIGFRKPPYELKDTSIVERTFYNIDPMYVEMFGEIPQNVILASTDLIGQAQINLEKELNPNLVITLADHLHFALERMDKGMDITVPIAYDVQHFFPLEYELGELALDIVQDYTGKRLPDNETVNIALHIVNSEAEKGKRPDALKTLKMIKETEQIIEKEMDTKLDRGSFVYNRFISHLRYLLQRLSDGDQIQTTSGVLLKEVAKECPDVYLCARKVAKRLSKMQRCDCTKDEILYLALHINRMVEK